MPRYPALVREMKQFFGSFPPGIAPSSAQSTSGTPSTSSAPSRMKISSDRQFIDEPTVPGVAGRLSGSNFSVHLSSCRGRPGSTETESEKRREDRGDKELTHGRWTFRYGCLRGAWVYARRATGTSSRGPASCSDASARHFRRPKAVLQAARDRRVRAGSAADFLGGRAGGCGGGVLACMHHRGRVDERRQQPGGQQTAVDCPAGARVRVRVRSGRSSRCRWGAAPARGSRRGGPGGAGTRRRGRSRPGGWRWSAPLRAIQARGAFALDGAVDGQVGDVHAAGARHSRAATCTSARSPCWAAPSAAKPSLVRTPDEVPICRKVPRPCASSLGPTALSRFQVPRT